jgi:hypothetical protein
MGTEPTRLDERLAAYPLLDALERRRSRRFGTGMRIESGPFAYESRRAPLPLTEAEEAALAFAACGITGYALADLSYGRGQGGSMLAGLLGRTVASPDAINTVSVFVTNDEATYLLKRPQDFGPGEVPALIELARRDELVELYRRSRIKIVDGRAAPPVEPGYNFNINRWALYAPGGTYFLPVEETTAIYVNAMLEAFDEEMAIFVLDERANFRPAGISRFARSKGGHLNDDPGSGRVATIQAIETSLMEACAIEQGMVLQKLGLMGQALGLGGYPNFARHEFGWFQTLGFRMGEMPASRNLGANRVISTALRLLGRDQYPTRSAWSATARSFSNPTVRRTTLRWRLPCASSWSASSARKACSGAEREGAAGRSQTRKPRGYRLPPRRPSRRPSPTAVRPRTLRALPGQQRTVPHGPRPPGPPP